MSLSLSSCFLAPHSPLVLEPVWGENYLEGLQACLENRPFPIDWDDVAKNLNERLNSTVGLFTKEHCKQTAELYFSDYLNSTISSELTQPVSVDLFTKESSAEIFDLHSPNNLNHLFSFGPRSPLNLEFLMEADGDKATALDGAPQSSDLKTCSNCNVTKTSRWCKDVQDKTKDVCQRCYKKAITIKKTKEGITCGKCSANQTSHWYKDPNDKLKEICRACYDKILLKKQQKRTIICNNPICKTTKSYKWYKDPNDKEQHICTGCYSKVLLQKQKIREIVCSNKRCKTTKILSWYKDPSNKGKYICNTCHDKVFVEKRAEQREQPKSCKTTKSPESHKGPDAQKKICVTITTATLYQKKS